MKTVETVTIEGYRGFANKQKLRLAQPDGQLGSGLTILVGPNNGGKSTVVEALDALFSPSSSVSFSEGKRNSKSERGVSIQVLLNDGSSHEIKTAESGGSETTRCPTSSVDKICYFLPSRRFFNPYFNAGTGSRQSYARNQIVGQTRSTPISSFSRRLFEINKNRGKFDEVLGEVMVDVPDWTIEQSDQGQYFLKIDTGGQTHTSDGLGEGIVSLFFMIDALYDASDDDLIVVDEPELSLHPQYQRRLLRLFASRAQNVQIVYATHSHLMVDVGHVLNGAEIARVHKCDGVSTISQLSRQVADELKGVVSDGNNPHVLGQDARETFFQEDGLVVFEGQEDVLFYPGVLDRLTLAGSLRRDIADDIKGRFFGWGAGGAGKITKILALFKDLGFRRVAAIVDGDKKHTLLDLKNRFPGYEFGAIPADDVRTKPKRRPRRQIRGLLDENSKLRPEYTEQTVSLFKRIGDYLRSEPQDNVTNACAD